MPMSVQQQRLAMPMLCVTIHMDHTFALAKQDIMETDEVAQVILKSLFYQVKTCYFNSVVYIFNLNHANMCSAEVENFGL